MLAAKRMIGTSLPDSRYSMDTRSGRYSTEDMAASRLRKFVNNISVNPLFALAPGAECRQAPSRQFGVLWRNILLPFNCRRSVRGAHGHLVLTPSRHRSMRA